MERSPFSWKLIVFNKRVFSTLVMPFALYKWNKLSISCSFEENFYLKLFINNRKHLFFVKFIKKGLYIPLNSLFVSLCRLDIAILAARRAKWACFVVIEAAISAARLSSSTVVILSNMPWITFVTIGCWKESFSFDRIWIGIYILLPKSAINMNKFNIY